MDDDLDCGDNSCMFASHRGGQRTNGGCRCLDGLEPKRQMVIRRRIARIAALERVNLQLREQYADAVQADKTASALPLKNQSTLITRLTERLKAEREAHAKVLQELHEERQRANDYLKADDIKREAHERTKAELAEARKDIKAMTCWRDCPCEARKMEAERDKAWAEAAAMRAALSDYHQVSHTSAAAEKKERALAGTAGRALAERVKRLEAVASYVRDHLALGGMPHAMFRLTSGSGTVHHANCARCSLDHLFAALDRGDK